MEIVKLNEIYELSNTASNGWKMSGQANIGLKGDLNINFGVATPGELSEWVGDMNYSRPADDERVSSNFNVNEPNRKAFLDYANTVIEAVLTKFNPTI